MIFNHFFILYFDGVDGLVEDYGNSSVDGGVASVFR